MGCTYTRAVRSPSAWKTRGQFSCVLIQERTTVRDGEKLMESGIQTVIYSVYIKDAKKAELFSHFLGLIKKYAMKRFSSPLFENTHSDLSEGLHHKVRRVIVMSVSILHEWVATVAYYDASYTVIEDFPNKAFSLLQRNFASESFGHTGK